MRLSDQQYTDGRIRPLIYSDDAGGDGRIVRARFRPAAANAELLRAAAKVFTAEDIATKVFERSTPVGSGIALPGALTPGRNHNC